MLISDYIVRTPLIKSAFAENVYLKPENLQPFRSYKIRGVANVIANTSVEKLREGLVTISAGNMAQAVAFAARELEIPCTVFVPDAAPEIKKQAIAKLGAKIEERSFQQVWEMVRLAKNPVGKGVLIHPTETPFLKEGYGAIAREIIHDMSDVEAIIIPFGVGGLSIGIANALHTLKPDTHIYLAEPATAAPFSASLRVGRPVMIERQPSFVDAIGTPEVLPAVFEKLSPFVHESIEVEIQNARAAIRSVYQNHGMIIEGAAGCALAAAQQISSRYSKVVCLMSGGNLDQKTLNQILEEHA